MAIYIYQNILWLDITINHVEIVQVLKAKQQLSEVEFGLFLGEPLYIAQMEEHLSTRTQIHDEEQLCL